MAFKLIHAIIAPVFLLGSLFCVCLPSSGAHAHAMRNDADATCCDHAGHGKDATPEHRPDCPHCGHSQVVKPDGTDANAIVHPVVAVFLPPGNPADIELLPRSAPPGLAEDHVLAHPPSSILRQKCVLVV